ncbi:hypothetical protein GRS66_006018 [Saccharomyces pastorianus]|uniref:Uncharacterized protein n=1 Tax=Saccharomyces pastorianus TaxID=27292 RepID=A0A6C1E3J3_SACPS|nr:hypothetical protein GRS66_006018 [Saccharomyces pastorianus]
MLADIPAESTMRRKSHLPNRNVPNEISSTALSSSTSSAVSYSSNNDDGSFDFPSDSSLSDISDVESSYTSIKRLKLENSKEGKNQSYNYFEKRNANALEKEASLDDDSKIETDDRINHLLTSASRTTYVSNMRDGLAENRPDLSISKCGAHEYYLSDSSSGITQKEEDIGVEVFRDGELDCCQVLSINNDELVNFQYPETETDMEFDEVFLTPLDGVNRVGKGKGSIGKDLNSCIFEQHTQLNSGVQLVGESNAFPILSTSNVSSLTEALHKIHEDKLRSPTDENFNASNVVIDSNKIDMNYLYTNAREELSTPSFSSKDFEDESFDNDDKVDEVIYRDDDSTDEDESLPPPDPRRKKIGSKACEIVDSRKVGINVPKLCMWSLSDKPFCVIDGLCTKSLCPLAENLSNCESSSSSSSPINPQEEQKENSPFDNDTMLTDLLNISEAEAEKAPICCSEHTHEPFSEIPKGPLSSFRDRGKALQDTGVPYKLNVSKFTRMGTRYVSKDQSEGGNGNFCYSESLPQEKKRNLMIRERRLKQKQNQGKLYKQKLTSVNNLLDNITPF